MYDHFLSLMDVIQIVLMLAACYACYKRGQSVGATAVLEKLEELGVVRLQRAGDEEVEDEEK